MVLVSHDRALLRATTDRFWLVANGTTQAFEGDLEDYRDWLLNRDKASAGDAPRAAPAPAAKRKSDTSAARRDSARAREALANQRKPVESRLKRIESQLARLNGERTVIKERLANPDLYASGDGSVAKQLMADEAYLTREIDMLEEEWLTQQAALEQIGALS
jgi:ATP-binding cassette subfamily F protein 3